MILYEVRVGKAEPLVFDNAFDAFREAGAFKAFGKRVSIARKTYVEGARCGTTRLSIGRFESLFKRLMRQCKGHAYVKATSVVKCCGSVDERDCWDEPMKATESAMACIAAKVAEFEPSSDLTIDDHGYTPKFYDAFYVMRVYAANELVGAWDLLYETPQADPKPHRMDW